MSNINKQNQERGIKAEYHVINELQERGLEINYVNSWYDIKIKEEKIEIKSSCISVKSSGSKKGKSSWEFGRFDFTKKEIRNKIWKNNVWLCFVIRWKTEFMILGFIQAKKLPERRYFKISQLRDERLLDINQFTERIRREEKQNDNNSNTHK